MGRTADGAGEGAVVATVGVEVVKLVGVEVVTLVGAAEGAREGGGKTYVKVAVESAVSAIGGLGPTVTGTVVVLSCALRKVLKDGLYLGTIQDTVPAATYFASTHNDVPIHIRLLTSITAS